MAQTLLFDMDGTLTDPFLGITGAYRAMLFDFGLPDIDGKDLRWTIGPALRVCLTKLLGTDDPEQIEEGVRRYRHHYVTQKMMLQDKPYPEIPELLVRCREAGYTCYVATAKPGPIARMILEHWRLDGYFAGIYGSGLDGSHSNKADLLAHLLRETGVPSETAIMIGDRHHDVDAAVANGLRSIGVLWGFGDLQELQAATWHVDNPSELWSLVSKSM
jgi:phosphoglycolate phosphatase